MVTNNSIKRLVGFFATFGVLFVASFCKVSFIVGSHNIFFSGVNAVYPLLGLWGGSVSVVAMIVRFVARYAIGASFSLASLAFIIPGIFVSLYMTYNHWAIRLLVPVVSMILFIAHPVGFYAAPYALFWLVPIGIYLFGLQSLSARLLASTFVGHAVGSVIWLYTVPMAASAWLALIPVVCAERVIFAATAFVLHAVVMSVISVVKKRVAYKEHALVN